MVTVRVAVQDAEDFYYYFAEEHADRDALDYFRRQRMKTLSKGATGHELPYTRPMMNRFTVATGKSYSGMFPGTYPLVGTPDDIVAEMIKLKAAGITGSALVFLNYLQEMPYFADEALPRMEKAGLRKPYSASHGAAVGRGSKRWGAN